MAEVATQTSGIKTLHPRARILRLLGMVNDKSTDGKTWYIRVQPASYKELLRKSKFIPDNI